MNILSLSYDELAKHLGVSVSGARKREDLAHWPRPKGPAAGTRLAVEATEIIPPGFAAKAMALFPDQPKRHQGEQLRMLEDRIAMLEDEVSALHGKLAKAERLAQSERYKAQQERNRVAGLTAHVQNLGARLATLQQRPWWRRLLVPRLS